MVRLGISRDRIITQASFLPFGPGIAVLTDRSDNGPEFYQLFDKSYQQSNTSKEGVDDVGFTLVPRKMMNAAIPK